jgi:hypothetical protein
MAKKKTIENMSAEELYALAQQKEQEEQDAQQEAIREEIESLRTKRRELVAKQKKELAAIDAKIRKLGGRTGGGRRRAGAGGKVTSAVLDILAGGKASTKDIKAALEAQGIVAKNLSQTLAYLKRTGRVTSPSRSVYALAK